MNVKELSHDQKLALTALMKAVALSNGAITEGAQREIAEVAKELGDEDYRAILSEADRKFRDLKELKNFLVQIREQEARELIFGLVWEESVADPDIRHEETELLSWLAEQWRIQLV